MKHLKDRNTFLTENSNPLQKPSNTPDIHKLSIGQKVKYRREDNVIDEKPVERLDLKDGKVYFKDHKGKEFSKGIGEIVGTDNGEEEKVEHELKNELGKVKGDTTKLKQVLKYVDFVEKE